MKKQVNFRNFQPNFDHNLAIETEFRGIIGLREKYPYHFKRNDLYFICLLSPKSSEITQCEAELSKCQWMDIDSFEGAEFKVETQERVAKLARKLLDWHRDGKNIEDICWSWDIVKTNLKTM